MTTRKIRLGEQTQGQIPSDQLADGTDTAGYVPVANGDGTQTWGAGTAGAPTGADYLTGTAQAGLSAEIVVGATPGGELGGTWASPTVDATHSGSTHSAASDTHVADTTAAHAAASIGFTPNGSIAATDVQAAIQEVRDEAGVSGYTDEAAQDAVGTILVDTATVDLTYSDATPSITAAVIPTGIKLDDLGATDDNTDLDASTSAHGLLKKLGGGTTNFLRADGAWAAPGAGAWVEIIKPSDQTVTNNGTPQSDSALSFSVDATAGYIVELYILYSGNNATGDYAWRFTYPTLVAAALPNGWIETMTTALAAGQFPLLGSTTQWPSGTSAAGTDAADTILCFFGRFMLFTNTSGTMQYQFCNNAAAAGRTSTTRAGSMLRYRKLV